MPSASSTGLSYPATFCGQGVGWFFLGWFVTASTTVSPATASTSIASSARSDTTEPACAVLAPAAHSVAAAFVAKSSAAMAGHDAAPTSAIAAASRPRSSLADLEPPTPSKPVASIRCQRQRTESPVRSPGSSLAIVPHLRPWETICMICRSSSGFHSSRFRLPQLGECSPLAPSGPGTMSSGPGVDPGGRLLRATHRAASSAVTKAPKCTFFPSRTTWAWYEPPLTVTPLKPVVPQLDWSVSPSAAACWSTASFNAGSMTEPARGGGTGPSWFLNALSRATHSAASSAVANEPRCTLSPPRHALASKGRERPTLIATSL